MHLLRILSLQGFFSLPQHFTEQSYTHVVFKLLLIQYAAFSLSIFYVNTGVVHVTLPLVDMLMLLMKTSRYASIQA